MSVIMRILTNTILSVLVCFFTSMKIYASDLTENEVDSKLAEHIEEELLVSKKLSPKFLNGLRTALKNNKWEFEYSKKIDDLGFYHVHSVDQYTLTLYGEKQDDSRIATLQRVWFQSPRG